MVMMHDIDDNAAAFDDMRSWIEEHHPGTSTFALAYAEGEPGSWANLNLQVQGVSKAIREIVYADPTIFRTGITSCVILRADSYAAV